MRAHSAHVCPLDRNPMVGCHVTMVRLGSQHVLSAGTDVNELDGRGGVNEHTAPRDTSCESRHGLSRNADEVGEVPWSDSVFKFRRFTRHNATLRRLRSNTAIAFQGIRAALRCQSRSKMIMRRRLGARLEDAASASLEKFKITMQSLRADRKGCRLLLGARCTSSSTI